VDRFKMDGHKLYWHLDRVSEWQVNRLIAPVYLEVSPVSYCNHKCIFCALDFAMLQKFKLDSHSFSRRLREMKGMVRSIMYAGEGEPLLHEDLPRLIQETKKSQMDAAITTNGSLGNYSLWKELLPSLEWLRFSFNGGSPETYARVHNVSEKEFYKALRSIEEATRVKRDHNLRTTIGVQYLLLDENWTDIEKVLALFSGMGLDYLSFKPYSHHPQMLKSKDYNYDEDKINNLLNIVSKYRKKSDCEIVLREEALKKYMNQQRSYRHCYALPFWGYIASDGEFYTCSVFIKQKEFSAGNIYEQPVKDIFTGFKRKQSIEFCEKELDISKCRINCRMGRINEFLEFLQDPPGHINFI